jgi:transcriptional regulator with XRE-family HTH domain
MSHWLGRTMRDARVSAHVRHSEVAGLARVAENTIIRLEAGENVRNAEQILAAYGYLLGVADPRDFLLHAIQRWIGKGDPPIIEGDDTTPEAPADRAVNAARLAAAAQHRARDRSAARDESSPGPAASSSEHATG